MCCTTSVAGVALHLAQDAGLRVFAYLQTQNLREERFLLHGLAELAVGDGKRHRRQVATVENAGRLIGQPPQAAAGTSAKLGAALGANEDLLCHVVLRFDKPCRCGKL